MIKINNLIIIGGPSCSGKSFLVNNIQQGGCHLLCEKLGVMDPHKCFYISRHVELRHINEPIIDTLIVHYDFFAHHWGKGGYIFINELLSNSSNVFILTLYTPLRELIRRINRRIFYCCILKLCGCETGYSIKNLWKKRKEYNEGFVLSVLYAKWFDLLHAHNISDYFKLRSGKRGNSSFEAVESKVADWRKVYDSIESGSSASWLSTALISVKERFAGLAP